MKKIIYKLLLILLVLFPLTTFASVPNDTIPDHGNSQAGEGKTHYNSNKCANGGCPWSYDVTSTGFRISLYKYTGGGAANLQSTGRTVDIIGFADGQTWGNVCTTTNRYGRLNYTHKGATVNFNNCTGLHLRSAKTYKNSVNTSLQPLYLYTWIPSQGSNYNEPAMRQSIIDYFRLKSNVADIATEVNNFFALTGNDRINPAGNVLPYYIITEPTIRLTVNGVSYYGTSYELNKKFYGQFGSTFLNQTLCNSIYSRLNQSNNDIYDLVAPRPPEKNSVNYLIDSVTSASTTCGQSINTNPRSAYGIGIYWLSAHLATCESNCGALGGDSLLACAEKWCSDETEGNATNKAYCMQECGVNPDDYVPTCDTPAGTKKSAPQECAGRAQNTVPSCAVKNVTLSSGANYYFTERCSLQTDVEFRDIKEFLQAGQGFSFPTLVSGNRTCRMEFSDNYWKYLYASLKNADKAKALEAIQDFEAKDFSSQKYNSSNMQMTMKVEYEHKGRKVENVDLIPKKIIKDNDVLVSKSFEKAKTIYSYSNGVKVEFKVKDINTESNNITEYDISPSCLSRQVNGKVYPAGGSACLSGDFGPYTKFYTDLQVNVGTEYKTSVTVTDHNLNGLGSSNICSTTVSKLSCSLIETSRKNGPIIRGSRDKYYYTGDIVSFTLQINGDRTKFAEAKVPGGTLISAASELPLKYEVPVKFVKDDSNTGYSLQKVDAWVRDKDGQVVHCPIELPTKDSPTCLGCVCILTETVSAGVRTYSFARMNENPQNSVYYIRAGGPFDVNNPASERYKRTSLEVKDSEVPSSVYATVVIDGQIINKDCEYLTVPKTCDDAINNCTGNVNSCIVAFCNNDAYRMSDPNNYAGVDDCINRCSGKIKTCKQLFHPNNNQDLVNIRLYCNANYLSDGYRSAAACISDCSALGADYFYRPVDNYNPFPSRTALGNWHGLEDLFVEDKDDTTSLKTGKAEYVIELDSAAIRSIKQNTAALDKTSTSDNAYLDYITSSDFAKIGKKEYRSKFIHDSLNNKGFSNYFTVINGKKK